MKWKLSAAMIAAAVMTASAGEGSIEGKVSEKQNSRPLAGMKVSLTSDNRSVVTDRDGSFRINGVTDGSTQLIISGIGYKSDTLDVTVEYGKVASIDITLDEAIAQMMKLTVSGQLQGQTRAYNIQKNSDNIKNVISADYIGRFPDQNSAEALQRINGVSVQRDQGEGRYVQIRGSKPNMTSVSINGVKIPAPEGDGRSVALDVVPADALGSIEVHKAITPEMDGDAIAGSVDLQTQKATSQKLTLSTTAALGYNNLVATKENGERPLNGQGSLSLGKRFGKDQKFGIFAGGSYMKTNRGSDNMEFGDWSKENGVLLLEEVEFRDYNLTRERIGANLTFDANLTENANIWVSGLYNRFGDDEIRLRSKINLEDATLNGSTFSATDKEYEKDLKARYEVQDILSVTAGTEVTIGKATLDAHIGYSYAQEDEPERLNTDFVSEDDTHNYTYNLNDPDFPKINLNEAYYTSEWYKLDKIEMENNITKDRNFEGALNLTFPLNATVELKTGAKGRLKKKERDNQFEEYELADGADDVLMSQFAMDYSNPEFMNGKYGNIHRNFADREKVREFWENNRNNGAVLERTDMNDAGLYEDNYGADYEATEKVGAGYLQGKFNFGNTSLLAGARGEYTGFIYNGYKVLIEEEEVSKTSGDKSQVDILPMVHAKHSFNDNLNLRFAYTRTFARPNFYDLVPYELINTDDMEKEIGNSDLEMQYSNNFDLLGEYYFNSIGLLSGGAFYKGMSDFIYNRKFVSGAYEVSQSDNADDAMVFGLEANYEMQFTFLPKLLSGFGLGANYTWTTSEATVKDEDQKDRTVTLPGQSDHILNAFIMYEMDYFNVKLAMNYHSEFLDEVGSAKEGDVYYDKHLQLDASAAVKPIKNKNLSIFAEFVNLTNEPLRYYSEVEGTEVAKVQEYYSWWSHFGVKYNF